MQNVASQAQSLPPMSQAAPTNGMAYMGYQPYSMQNMISALPGQDPNMPPPQPYMPGHQPMYQQVSPLLFNRCPRFCVRGAELCLLMPHFIVARWLPLVAHRSNSSRHSNRPLKLFRVAQRHSSFPSIERAAGCRL